jgi:hypothetical protein
MAAAIRAIENSQTYSYNIYPEILIGTMKDLEANYLIKNVLFTKKVIENSYTIDERGQIWLNLDYTAKYPGGPFMSEEIWER